MVHYTLVHFLIVLVIAGIGVVIGFANKEEGSEQLARAKSEVGLKKKEGNPMSDQVKFTLESPAFADNDSIPVKFAASKVSGGENISMPLSWRNAPENTKSFVVAVIDHHPVANNWVHWVVINIPNNINSIPEGASGTTKMPQGSRELANTAGYVGYGGPAAPPGTGPHGYEATVYALDVDRIDLSGYVTESQLESALRGKIIASARTTGMFER